MNIVFCVDGIYPFTIGGMQRHSRLLIETIAVEYNHNIVVIHPHSGTQVFESHLHIKEIVIDDINLKNNYLLECYRYSKRVYNKLITLPENFVIYSQGLSVWYRAVFFENRLIVNPHGLEPFQALSFREKLIAIPFKIIFRHVFCQSLFVISLGGKLTSILRKEIPEKKIYEIPNGVCVPELVQKKNGIGSVITKVLFVARFAHNKGIHILMQAISELNNEGFTDKFEFVFVGNGPLYEKFKLENVEHNVQIRGFVSDKELVDLYNESSIFVLPTLFEGMPTVVLEAMANRLPIIVTDTGATAVLVDETNGYLIQKNSVEALKCAFIDFMKLSNSEKISLADHSVQKVKKRFTWNLVAKEHNKLLNFVGNKLNKSDFCKLL